MIGLYDDPIFGFRDANCFGLGRMARAMDAMERRMNRLFWDFDDFAIPRYHSFLRDAFDTPESEEAPAEKKDSEKPSKEAKQPAQAETPKPAEEQKPKKSIQRQKSDPFFYSSTISSYSGSDGVEHIRREVSDSRSGKTTLTETRRIGDKALTLHRETSKDGSVNQQETRTNLEDNEIEAFEHQWESRFGKVKASEQKSICDSKKAESGDSAKKTEEKKEPKAENKAESTA